METYPSPNSKSFRTDDEFDLETSDRSRLQSLQPIDCTLSIIEQSREEIQLIQKIPEKYSIKIYFDSIPSDFEAENSELSNIKKPFRESLIEKKFSLLSLESGVTSEDLIMNEDIDFLNENSSERSDLASYSLSYTRTEIKDQMSSVFNTFNWQEDLMKSLPQSQNGTVIIHNRTFETEDPCFTLERMDIEEYNLNYNFEEISFRDEHKIENACSAFETVGYPAESLGEEGVTNFENSRTKCGCGSCSLM